MWVHIDLIRRLWHPYPPDTHNDVHIRAEFGTLRERKRLPPKERPSSVCATPQGEKEEHAPWPSDYGSYGMARAPLRAST